jgi:hypothetical protein
MPEPDAANGGRPVITGYGILKTTEDRAHACAALPAQKPRSSDDSPDGAPVTLRAEKCKRSGHDLPEAEAVMNVPQAVSDGRCWPIPNNVHRSEALRRTTWRTTAAFAMP